MYTKGVKSTLPNFEIERGLSEDHSVIAGVDEVGRGSIAGPIVAAAVVFKKYNKIIEKLSEVNDSKKLTPLKRFELDRIIRTNASDLNIGIVEADEIDKIGIGAANILAFKKALDGLKECDLALIDGRQFYGFEYQFHCIEKGENKSISVAAASIIAKVYRDNIMEDIHEEIFRYDFASNKGYGSKHHFDAIEKYGLSRYHRKSFLKKIEDKIIQNKLF
jgi:ribonuclease HII